MRTGWETGCPVDDTISRQAVVNLAGRVNHHVRSMGGRTHTDELWSIGDMGLPCPFANVAVALQPVADAAAVTAIRSYFTAPGDEMERFMYVASVLHCLPVGMVEDGSAGTGTVIRADTVRRYAAAAGFTSVNVLPVEHPQFRLYHLEG